MFSSVHHVVGVAAVVGVMTSGLACGGPASVVEVGGDASGRAPQVGAAAAAGWSAPVTLAPEGRPVSASVSPDGDLAAVWQTQDGPRLAVRPAGGEWSDAAPVARYAGLAEVAYDGSGDLVLAWGDHRPGLPARVRVRQLSAGTWSPAQTVARRDQGDLGVVDLAVNRRGAALLAWQWEKGLQRTGFVSRGHVGADWTTGLRVPHAAWLEVAIGDGGLAAAMVQQAVVDPSTSAADLTWAVARQYRQRPWSSLRTLQTLTDVGPPWPGPGDVHVDGAGRTTAAWDHRGTDGRWRIVAARAVQGQPWQQPKVLARRVGWGDFPVRVTGAQQGELLVTYVRQPANGWLEAVRWANPGWERPVSVSGDVRYVNDWDAAMDSSGAAVALWTPSDGPGTPGRGVTAALLTASGSWAAPQRLSKAETPDGHARVAAMGAGQASALWSQRLDDAFGVLVRTHR